MPGLLCHSVSLGTLGNVGLWGGIGLTLSLVIWIGLLGSLVLLALLAMRRARAPAAGSRVSGQATASGENP